uniref:Nuclear factor NF-kappa-B p105 subunit n=1 Tax=Stichopus japonicus TaxID=307972 RepID=G4XLY2_STIJA|nr:nuclear factor NF-kappa-B p105 subunit [Apostichopus japonicus]
MTDEKTDSSHSIELPVGMLNALRQDGDLGGDDVNMGAGAMMDLDLNPIGLNLPNLKILEQPKSRGFRFRYGCEGPSHGGLPGEHSQKGKKSYPSVEIVNYKGDARIVVSLVTDEEVPKPHAHSLVGKHCCNGICTVQVGPKDLTACFQNLGIQHVTRKEVIPVLKKRILEHQKVYNALIGPNSSTQIAEEEAEKRAKSMAKDMDLSRVKLCFQAYFKDSEGRFTRALSPVLSNVVYDSKAPNATTLKICRMDKSSGSARGGDEVHLLCDKVQKDDIEVRFFEVNSKGDLTWDRSADFGPTDVHRQYAIVFRTPVYRDGNIEKPVSVQVQLRRKSDNEVSDPKPFTYHPPIQDREGILRKRAKRLPNFDQGAGPGSDGGGGGGLNLPGFPFSARMPPGSYTTNGLQLNNGMGMQRDPTPQIPQSSQPVVTHPEMIPGINHLQQRQQHHPIIEQPQQMFMQMQQQQHQQPHQHQIQQQQQQHQIQQNGANGVVMNGITSDMQAGGTHRGPFQIKPEPEDSDDSSGSVEIEVTKSDTERMALAEQFGGPVFADSFKFRTDEPDFGLDFGGDIEADACAAPVVGQMISGYESDDEGVDDIVTIKKNLRERSSNREAGLKPDVEEDSRTSRLVQTDDFEVDYEAKVWEFAEVFSRCLQEYGRTGDVRILVQAQSQLCSEYDENGDTPLHLAVIHKQPEALQAILDVVTTTESQSIVNQKNKLFQTPLHLAVITEQVEMVRSLMKCGADPNILDQNGYNALHHAVDAGVDNAIATLIEGPPTGNTSVPLIKVNPDALNLDGYSALHMAVEKKRTSSVRALVKSGANKDIPDGKSGRAPLHYAVLAEDFNMLSYLVADARANIEVEDFVGNTPLHLASAYDLSAVAALLIAAGSNPDVRNCDGNRESDIDEGCDVSEEEDGEEDRTGSSALDFAQSDKMRQILRGEKYMPRVPSSSLVDTRNKSHRESYRSAMSTAASTDNSTFLFERLRIETQLRHPPESKQSDILMLPQAHMKSLVSRLDIAHPLANDWRAVADRLGMGNMINHLRMFASPTQVLLDQYAVSSTIEPNIPSPICTFNAVHFTAST